MKTRFILIQTSHAGNVGGVARAMKVMGFTDLVLVAPRWANVLRREETIQRASGALDVLRDARIVDTLDEALKKLEPYRLDGVVQKMRCPFLIVHGELDEQIPLAHAQALLDASGSKDKALRVFTREEGGHQHCQRDYLTLGVATMWDWFEDKLVRS